VDEVKKHLSQLNAREEAAAREKARQEEETARKEKERLEAQAKARQEVEARAQREAKEARKAREAALKESKAAEAKKPPVEKGPPRVKKVWIWSGAGAVTVAIVGVLIFMLFGPEGAAPEPTDTTTPTPTESTATTPTPIVTTPPAPIKPYGTIIIATDLFNNEAIDPNTSGWLTGDYSWSNALYDPLITYDETGNYIGAVAESWTTSPDGNTWTFHIRQGIKFHNGDPLTAEDVKFSVDRFGENTTNV
jgi:hypothetical protein